MMKYQNATNKMTQFVTVKSLIWPWGQNSRSTVTNNGTRHIVWRWSIYMPNMKSLSWTTKKLHPGHDLLRMQELIWPWGQKSRSKVINNGTRHIVWRWSTYMPNMKSLSWTTNQRLSRACIVHLVIKKNNWSYVKTMSCVILELRST